MVRSKPYAKPVAKAKVPQADEAVECPLCIETLDDTDRDFFPCPCGYQVCLFCYQRLQSEYNNTCPGCRQQYSDDLDAVRQHIERKQRQQQIETSGRPASSSYAPSHSHGHTSHAHHDNGSHANYHAAHHAARSHAPMGHALSHAANYRPLARPQPISSKQQHQSEPPNRANQEATGSGLPPTANWVNAAANSPMQLSSVDSADTLALAAADDPAWPSLGAAACSSSQQKSEAGLRRQSSSSSLSSMQSQHQQQAGACRQDTSRSSCDSSVSTLTAQLEQHQQAQQQQQEQQERQLVLDRDSSGFSTVEVTTVVSGARHSVCVPVSSHSGISPFPEAATLLDMLQQAVNGNKLSSTEAAIQLVQCLRKLETDSQHKQQQGWLQQALASSKRIGSIQGGRSSSAGGNIVCTGSISRPPAALLAGSTARAPPPGFGPAAAKAAATYTPHLQCHQQQQQSTTGQVPSCSHQHAQRPSDNCTLQSTMHSVGSNSSLFSQGSTLSQSQSGLWTDAGLPGVDFSGVGGWGMNRASSIVSAVPPKLQMLWANNSNGQDSSTSADAAPAAADTSPIFAAGFSSGLGLNSSSATGSSSKMGNSSNSLLGGGYNPLSYGHLGPASQHSAVPGWKFGVFSDSDAAAQAPSAQQPSLYQSWS